MTGRLKDVMHDRADSLDAPDLDVAAMVRDGDRRVARRRTRTAGVGDSPPRPRRSPPSGSPPRRPATAPAARSRPSPPPSVPMHRRTPSAHRPRRRAHLRRRPRRVRDVQSSRRRRLHRPGGHRLGRDGNAAPLEVGRTHARHPASRPTAPWSLGRSTTGAAGLRRPRPGDRHRRGPQQPVRPSGMGRLRDEPDPALVYAVDGGEVYVRDSAAWSHGTRPTDRQRVVGAGGRLHRRRRQGGDDRPQRRRG